MFTNLRLYLGYGKIFKGEGAGGFGDWGAVLIG